MGGSGEKIPRKDMEKKIFPTFKFVLKVYFHHFFLLKNPTHWGLEIAVCPILANIFVVCSLVPRMNLPRRTIYVQKSKLLTREG